MPTRRGIGPFPPPTKLVIKWHYLHYEIIIYGPIQHEEPPPQWLCSHATLQLNNVQSTQLGYEPPPPPDFRRTLIEVEQVHLGCSDIWLAPSGCNNDADGTLMGIGI